MGVYIDCPINRKQVWVFQIWNLKFKTKLFQAFKIMKYIKTCISIHQFCASKCLRCLALSVCFETLYCFIQGLCGRFVSSFCFTSQLPLGAPGFSLCVWILKGPKWLVLTFDLAQHSCCIFIVGCINSKWGWKILYCIGVYLLWNMKFCWWQYIFYIIFSCFEVLQFSLLSQIAAVHLTETAILLRKEWGGAAVGRRRAKREREREENEAVDHSHRRFDSCRFPGSHFFLFCAAGLILKTYSEVPDSTCHVSPPSLQVACVRYTVSRSFRSLELERNWQLSLHLALV